VAIERSFSTKGFADPTKSRQSHMLMLKGSQFSPRLVTEGDWQSDGSWRLKLFELGA